jgi:hypothetical protein
LHDMAYYIFLKSLRSLEEFRKNAHVKIPPKSPCTNFPSLGKFKNPILIRKLFFLISAQPPPLFSFRTSHGPPPSPPPTPVRPVGQIRSRRPQAAAHALGPLGPSHVGVFSEGIFSLTLCTLAETPSLSHVTAMWGPSVSFIPFLPPPPADRCQSSPPATPRCPASNLEMPGKVFTQHLDFTPLTRHQAASPSMALRPLPLAVSPFPAPVCPPRPL